ncbi:MAG: hypothetical protein R3Y22_02300 [Bacteroidales bacterium]
MLSTLSSIIAAEYEYTFLVRENVEWGYTYSYPVFEDREAWYENTYYKIRFHGDIEIEGKTYKKAYRYNTETFNESTAILAAYMCEEDKVVYMIPVSTDEYMTMNKYEVGTEYITFNFACEYGESFPTGIPVGTTDYDWYQCPTVDNIESVLVNGKERRAYFGWIVEGMGIANTDVNHGDLIFPFTDLVAGTYMNYYTTLNYERDLTTGEIVYIDKYADYDDPAISGVKGVVNDKVEAVVTNDGQMLNVTTPNSRCKSVRVLNISGELVRNITCDSSTSQVAIPTETLPTAIYIIIVETDCGMATAKACL